MIRDSELVLIKLVEQAGRLIDRSMETARAHTSTSPSPCVHDSRRSGIGSASMDHWRWCLRRQRRHVVGGEVRRCEATAATSGVRRCDAAMVVSGERERLGEGERAGPR